VQLTLIERNLRGLNLLTSTTVFYLRLTVDYRAKNQMQIDIITGMVDSIKHTGDLEEEIKQ